MRSLQRIVLAGALMVLAVPAFAQQVSPDEVDQPLPAPGKPHR